MLDEDTLDRRARWATSFVSTALELPLGAVGYIWFGWWGIVAMSILSLLIAVGIIIYTAQEF